MNRKSNALKDILPTHPPKTYNSVGTCIYCGSKQELEDEHIIPLGMGGRMVLPDASCRTCSGITSAFEGTCQRTMFGSLRILYDMPTRRRKERPDTLPIKIKRGPDDDWVIIQVPIEEAPFIVLFPHYDLPNLLSGIDSAAELGPETRTLWIRGGSIRDGIFQNLKPLAETLGVYGVQPFGEARMVEFCLMLAKIAHSFAVAELGEAAFVPYLREVITKRELTNRATVIGGLMKCESASPDLHNLSIRESPPGKEELVVVRLRLFARLGTPTYFVVAGRRNQSIG